MKQALLDITYKQFGAQLLETYDLDPLYAILSLANFQEDFLKRWLLAYWVFYSSAVASHIAEVGSKRFYTEMYAMDKAHAPRGYERRHMRGQIFIDTVGGLRQAGCPEKIVDYMTGCKNFQSISRRVQEYHGFGPWISWKIADMTERVLQQPVSFDDAELGVYRDPVKGAALIRFGDQKHIITLDELHEVVDTLLVDFRGYMAPPYNDRPINIQEIETILCKYKSHINGHYPPGNDTREIYHGLNPEWGDTAMELKRCLRPYYQAWES